MKERGLVKSLKAKDQVVIKDTEKMQTDDNYDEHEMSQIMMRLNDHKIKTNEISRSNYKMSLVVKMT